MKQSLLHKRIPTVFALFLLIAGLITTAVLVQNRVFTTSKATPYDEPQGVEITNITSDSFTVVFTTLDPTIAAVNLEDANPQRVIYDVRNPDGNVEYISHFITVTNLKPSTKYSFTIIANGNAYQQNGKSFITTTALDNALSSSSQAALSGNVLQPDGTLGSDVLIQASIPNAAPVAAVTDSQGNYTIPTNLVRNLSHDQIITLVPDTTINLTATKGSLVSKISYAYAPGISIPTISLAQNYSFTASQEEQQIGTQSSLLNVPSGPKQPPQIKITTPQNNQSFTDDKPQFRGTALPSTLITITIHSDPISVQLRTDPNGNWVYRPAVALSPGQHTITIQAPNLTGATQTITNTFTVFASGSQVAESATPSATPKVTPTLTPTPTILPTATSTPVPTVGLGTPTPTPTPTTLVTPTGVVPTATPTILPTVTPTPTTTAVIPTKAAPPGGTVPPTGDTTSTIFLTTISILFIVSGSALLFIL